MADRELLVRIVGDDRDLQRALTSTERSVQRIDNRTATFGKNLSRAFGAAGIAIGTREVFLGLQKSVDAASDLNEQISRTEVVLGSSAQEMIEWSRTTANSIGISQRAALAATGTFAGLFQTVGVGQVEAGELSRSLVKLAADLASLQNSSPEEALIALRSGLAGESEPLRRFNIFLTEARVSQQALTDTGKASVRTLTQQEKTLARYNLILKDSSLAQGNFAATSGELANQQRVLAANIDNLSASIGGALVPVLVEVTGAANDAFVALSRLFSVDVGLGLDVGDLAGYIGGWKTINFLIDQAKGGIESLPKPILGEGVQPGVGGGQRAAARGQRAAQEQREKADKANATAGNAAIGRIEKQASAQKSFNQQIADSEKRAAHLRDLIREDPDNLKLQQRLTAELQLQSSLRAQQVDLAEEQARLAEQNAAAARATTIAIAELAVTQATLTKGLEDDLAAVKERESTLKRLVALNREDVDLANQLVAATLARRDIEAEIRQQKQANFQGVIFKRLGLTEEGDERVPGGAALRKRARSLLETIKGTPLDTEKNRKILRGIINTTNKEFRQAGRAVRQAALGMLNDIDSAFDDKKGPLTKTTSLNSKKLLANIGLSPEEIRELRGRLSNFNSAGVGLAGGNGPNSVTGGGATSGLVVENNLTISIDGKRIHAFITSEDQKTRRRNPKQKRGPNRNR